MQLKSILEGRLKALRDEGNRIIIHLRDVCHTFNLFWISEFVCFDIDSQARTLLRMTELLRLARVKLT